MSTAHNTTLVYALEYELHNKKRTSTIKQKHIFCQKSYVKHKFEHTIRSISISNEMYSYYFKKVTRIEHTSRNTFTITT